MATKTVIPRSKGTSPPSATAAKPSNKTPAAACAKSQSAPPSSTSKKMSAAKPGRGSQSPKSSARKSRKKQDQGEPVPRLVPSTLSSTESEDSDSSLPGRSTEAGQRHHPKNRPSATVPSPQKKRPAVAHVIHEPAEQVYCGPTFNNAPAPSALPLPAFVPQQRNRTSSMTSHSFYSSAQEQPFLMDTYLQLQSQEILHLLSPRQPRQSLEPLQPQYPHWQAKHTTSHKLDIDRDVSEIQRGLRSMLKIEA